MTALRVLWFLLLTSVTLDQSYYGYRAILQVIDPGASFVAPFSTTIGMNGVGSLTTEAQQAGLRRGDHIISVGGRPYRGFRSLVEGFETLRPGDTLALEVARGNSSHSIRIPLQADLESKAFLTIGFYLVTVLLLAVGFTVTWMRPADPRAWILLLLLLGFVQTFRFEDFCPSNIFLLYNTVWNVRLLLVWPPMMVLMAVYFPARMRLSRLVAVTLALLFIPLVFSLITIEAMYLARVENLELARSIETFREPWGRLSQLWIALAVTSYFMALTHRIRFEPDPDVRRRLVLQITGSGLTMGPMLILTVGAAVTGRGFLNGAPLWVIVVYLVLTTALPLTLAYLVVVHRVLDIRIVLRTGLQYALAQRTIDIIRFAITAALIFYISRLLQSEGDRTERIITIALAAGALGLLRSGGERIRQWTDRRFFRAAYDAENILSELSDEVRTIVETQPLLETVARRLSQTLQVNKVAMLIQTNGAYTPAFALGYGAGPTVSFPSADPVPNRLRDSRLPQTLYLDDPKSWVNREIAGEPRNRLVALESQLLLPLAPRNDLLGFISLGPKRSEEPYSRSDLQLLRSVAVQTGLALENSRLTATIAEEAMLRERLNREMEIARDVQRRLFPQKLPKVPGLDYAGHCRPAQSVGGDYYDFLETPHHRFAFGVGDVSGKGVPAALLMSVLHAAIRAESMHAEQDVSELISHVNKIVYDASAKNTFATLFYGQYNVETKKLVYVSAGHNSPLLLRRSGSVEWLKPTGPGAGLTRLSRYTQMELTLEPGDVLIAFTDGFPEAMNTAQNEFGEDRLLEAAVSQAHLDPAPMLQAILAAVDRFTQDAPQHDDMTMVILRTRP